MMRRGPSILLVCAFGLLGSGLLHHLHARAHELEDLAASEACECGRRDHRDSAGEPSRHGTPLHDENNCDLHAALAAPLLAAGYVPLLICLGLFVAFLTQLDPVIAPRRAPAHINCRGPPLV